MGALACVSLCFCCSALVVGCSSHPLTPARLCPCDWHCPILSPVPFSPAGCIPQVPSLTAIAQPGPLLPALASRAFPHQLLLGELLPKPLFPLSNAMLCLPPACTRAAGAWTVWFGGLWEQRALRSLSRAVAENSPGALSFPCVPAQVLPLLLQG